MIDMSQSGVIVGASDSIVLLIASFSLDQGGSSDHVAEAQFAVDDTRQGPPLLVFKDNTDKGCGLSIVWALTGISGSHKFALQWRATVSSPLVDTGRVRSFQVIEITDASFLVNISATSTDDPISSYTDLADMDDNQAPASADSILLLIANHQTNVGTSNDESVSHQFEIDGTGEGPEPIAFIDAANDGCGSSWMWLKTGISSAIDWIVQWKEINQSITTDDFLRTFQVIEITDNANLLSAITSVAAHSLGGSYADVDDLVDTVDVVDEDSILLFGACFPGGPSSDDTGVFRFFEDDDGEGPEVYCFQDDSGGHDGCGHSIYHAVSGKSAGSHTFSLRGQNITGTYPMATGFRRSFTLLELTAGAPTQVDKDAVDDLDLAINPEVADLTALIERQEAIDLVIANETAEVVVVVDPVDQLDISLVEDAELRAEAEIEDALDLVLGEDSEVAAGLTAEDVIDLAIEEEAEVTAGLEAEDLAGLAIVEAAAQVDAGITAADDLDLEIDEGVPAVLVRIQPEDATGLTAEDLADLLAAAQRLDNLGITTSEVAQVVAALNAFDTLDLAIDSDTGLIIVIVAATDDLGLVLSELAQLLGILGVSDSLDLVIDDAAGLLVLLSRSDVLDLVIDDAGQVAVLIQAADTVDLAIDEAAAQVVVGIIAEDKLDLTIAEAVDLLALLERSDTLAIGLVEGAPVIFAVASVEDTLDLALDDSATVQVPIEVSDLLDLQIDEVGEVVAAVQASDLLDLAVDELSELTALLSRSDVAELNISEETDLQAFIQALDSIDLALDEQIALVSIITAADQLDISIDEVAQVVNVLVAADTLGLTIAEASDLFIPPLFEGVIVQPFTLTVCREVQIQLEATRQVQFQLEVVREVQFTLQIEGSGVQT